MKRLFGCLILALAFVTVCCGSYVYAYEKSHCSDTTLRCMKNKGSGKEAGKVNMGQCFCAFCFPPGCNDCPNTDYGKYATECNDKFSTECEDNCYACSIVSGGEGALNCYDKDGHVHNPK